MSHLIQNRFAPLSVTAAGRSLHGVAAPYAVETRVQGQRERIARGAFAGSLSGAHDVLALVDHDPTRVLARISNATLRLSDTPEGLSYEIDLPDTPTAAEVRGLAQAGSLGGVSIGFRVRPGGEAMVGGVRELRALDLIEISVVSSFPAYPGTSADLRSATPRLNRVRLYMETL